MGQCAGGANFAGWLGAGGADKHSAALTGDLSCGVCEG